MIADFLDTFRTGGPWLLVAISPDKKGSPLAATFNDAAKAQTWAMKQNETRNVYFSVNPTTAPLNKKPTKADIAHLEWLHVDVDPRAGENFEEERARIKSLLNGSLPKDIPAPSLVIDSGGGFQAFWRLAEPLALEGSAEKIAQAEAFNIELARRLGGDHCHNVDRIMRLPGTMNWPDAKKRAKGRERAPASVASYDAALSYALTHFGQSATGAQSTATTKPAKRTQKRQAVPAGTFGTAELLAWAEANGKQIEGDALMRIADGDASGYGGDRSAMVFRVVCGLVRAGVPDEMIVGALLDRGNVPFSAHVYDQNGNRENYAWKQVESARARVMADAQAKQLVPVEGGSGCLPKWDRKTKDGEPLTSFGNTVEALRVFGLCVGYDEFRKQRIVGGHYLQDYAGALSDEAEVFLRGLVRKHFGFDTGKDNLHDAIAELAQHNRFDSLREHVAALPAWDGEKRLDSWLIDYFGATNNVYSREVGAIVLIAAITRAFEPGAKFDYMLVLLGAQGIRKSTAVRILAGGDAFFSDASLLAAKDTKEILELTAGVWIQECAELDGISHKATETLKAMIVRTHDKARAAYGRTTQEVARRFVMIGTTNERRFLRDTTGNRRFWPVEVEAVNIEGLTAVRDQLLAEALARYRAGSTRLWLGDEADAIARRLHGEYLAVDGSYRELLEYLEPDGMRDGLPYAATETVYARLGIAPGARSGAVAHRVAAAMASLGWRGYPHPITHEGKKQRIYVRSVADYLPPTSPPDEKPPF